MLDKSPTFAILKEGHNMHREGWLENKFYLKYINEEYVKSGFSKPILKKPVRLNFITERSKIEGNLTWIGGVQNLRLKLLTGTVDLKQGFNIVATGCGSGKTTAIKDLIVKHFTLGILYCAHTIQECDHMVNYLAKCGLGEYVVVLHSEVGKRIDEATKHGKFYDGLNTYYRSLNILENPEYLANAPIVICTHAKLNSLPPQLLLELNFSNKVDIKLDSIFDKMRGTTKILRTRQFILIDERLDKLEVKLKYDPMIFNGTAIDPLKNPVDYRIEPLLIKAYFSEKIQNYTNITGKHPAKGPDKLAKYITDFVVEYKIDSLGEDVMEIFTDNGFITFTYDYFRKINQVISVSNLVDNCLPTVLILDALGDYNYRGMDDARFHNVRSYKSDINVVKLKHKLDRYSDSIKEDGLLNDPEVNGLIEEVSELLPTFNKTLLVVPMTVDMIQKGNESSVDAELEEEVKKAKLAKWVKSKLESKPELSGIKFYLSTDLKSSDRGYDTVIPENKFESNSDKICVVTYLQAPDTRSINSYRDFDSVIILGRIGWSPNKVAAEYNSKNSTRVSGNDLEISMLHQAICRTRIRNYDETQPINLVVDASYHETELLNDLLVSFWNCNLIDKIKYFDIVTRKFKDARLNKIDEFTKGKISENLLNNGDILELKISREILLMIVPELKSEAGHTSRGVSRFIELCKEVRLNINLIELTDMNLFN